MHKERLLALSNFLDSVPPERFSLVGWADNNFSQNECGTVACACGWATVLFDELTLERDDYFGDTYLVYEDFTYWEAVVRFFEIHIQDANALFSPSCYNSNPTPSVVANRIRQYVREHGKETVSE